MTEASMQMMIRAEEELSGIDTTIAKVKQMSREFKRFAKTVRTKVKRVRMALAKLKRAFVKLNNAMRTLRNVALRAHLALVALTGIPIGVYAKFEKELSNVNTLMGNSRDELKKYEKQVISMSNRMGKSSTELSQGLYDVVSAGVSAGNSIAVLEKATKASVAGITNVNTAVKAGMATINSYNLSMDKLNKVYDLQFSTVKEGIVTYEQLANNIGKVLPNAKSLNASLEEVYGSLSFLTKAGHNADLAATELRRTFGSLVKKSEEIKSVFNFSIYDSQGSFIGLQNTIKNMRDQLQGLTNEQKQAMLKQVGFSERARKAILPMIDNYEQFEAVLGDVSNSSGAMEEAFGLATDNIAFHASRVKEKFVNTVGEFGSIFREEVIIMMKSIWAWLGVISDFVKSNKEAIKSVLKFALKFTAVASAVLTVATALTSLLTPIGVIMTGVSLLASTWYLNIFGIREKTQEAWRFIKDQYNELVEKGVIDKIENWGTKALKLTLKFVGDIYKKVKEEKWNELLGLGAKGLTLALGLSFTKAMAKMALTSITGKLTSLTMVEGATGTTAAGVALGVVSLGIKLKQAMNKGDYTDFIWNVLSAIAMGSAVFALTGSPGAGVMMFNVALNFEFGEKAKKGLKKTIKNVKDAFNNIKKEDVTEIKLDFDPVGFNHGWSGKKGGYVGFDSGGYTGGAGVNEVRGVVHSNEYVLPAWMVKKMPEMVAMLENIRSKGYKSGGIVGYQSGGYVKKNKATLQGTALENNKAFQYLATIAKETKNFKHIVTLVDSIMTMKEDLKEQLGKSDAEIEKLKNKLKKELENIKDSVDEQTNELASKFKDVANSLNNFLSNAESLFGSSSGLTKLTNLTDKVSTGIDFISQLSSGASKTGGFLESSGMLEGLGSSMSSMGGSLASMAGPIGAIVGIGSMLGNMKDKERMEHNRKELKEWQKMRKMDNKHLKNLQAIKENTNKTAKNLLKWTSKNPTNSNIDSSKNILNNLTDSLKTGIRPDFGKFTVKTKIEEDGGWFHSDDTWWETDTYNLVKHLAPQIGKQFKRNSDKGIGMNNLTFEGVKKFYDRIKGFTDDDFSPGAMKHNEDVGWYEDWANKMDVFGIWGGDKEVKDWNTNIEAVKKKIRGYIDTIEDLTKMYKKMGTHSRLESFQGIDWLSMKEQVDAYHKKLEKLYSKTGRNPDEYQKQINQMVNKYKKELSTAGGAMVTIMQDVSSQFASSLSKGDNMVQSFASGLSSYFSSLKNNIASMFYNINFDRLNEKFKNVFGNISKKLASYSGDNLKEYIQQIIGGKDIQSLFQNFINMYKKQGKMKSLNEMLSEQFREMAEKAGLKDSEISSMLDRFGLSVKEATEEMRKFTGETKNAPSGFKQARFGYQVAGSSLPENTRIEGNTFIIPSNSPEELIEQIRRLDKNAKIRKTGTPAGSDTLD